MVELDPGMFESVRQRLFHLRDRLGDRRYIRNFATTSGN